MEGDPDSTLARILRFGLGPADAPPAPEAARGAGDLAEAAAVPLVQPLDPLFFPLTPAQTSLVVREALGEDEAFNDVTTLATVLSSRHARGRVVARQPGVVAGVLLAIEAFRQLDPRLTVRVDVPDGAAVPEGTPVLFLSGHARGILSAERVALNFMQRLSGVASLTAKYVQAVAGTGARSSTRARPRRAGGGWRSSRCAPAAGTTTAWTSPRRCSSRTTTSPRSTATWRSPCGGRASWRRPARRSRSSATRARRSRRRSRPAPT
jgi:hypothetical protein